MTIKQQLAIIRICLNIFLILVLSPALVVAEHSDQQKETEAETKPVPEPTLFITRHRGRFNGETVSYTATAGETYLRDKQADPKASIFTFAYTRDEVKDVTARPVTFVWNGGPGSASLWLHMGTVGPKRVVVPSDAAPAGAPPYKVVDAPGTLLDVTDLVFVDPVGTGFSRPLGKHEGKEFWGLNEDAESIAEFIRVWITQHKRWNSPKFLLGESFGTTRAAAVAELLEGSKDMISLNGLIFISQALDYTGSSPYQDNLIAFVTYLPTMAATAWYHGKVNPRPESLAALLQDARRFATDELLPALFRGNTLDNGTREQIRDRLAYFTGLDASYIERAGLRVQGFRFAKELLRAQGLAVGLLDGRYTQDEIDDVDDLPDRDAASDSISSAFKAAFMDYISRDLNVDWDRHYLAPEDDDLESQWRWRPVPDDEYWEPMPVNTAPQLSQALRRNPDLKVMVASGYYDLITPFFDAEYTLNRHGIQTDRVTFKYYNGGHMMYLNEPSRTRLLKDMREFIELGLGHHGQ